ncbi:MAG: hypothetical protein H6627_04095 [Calditrichae bacterium]|nr:hypothetical protein [Calditrichia bacterium]
MRISLILTFAIFLIVLSCSEDNSTGPVADNTPENNNIAPTFSEINTNVFQASCAFSGCHANNSRQAGLDLSSSNSYNSLVGVTSTQNPGLKRVDPGNSAGSYLLKKLKGDGTTRMPLRQAALSQDKIDMITAWIDAGAENN